MKDGKMAGGGWLILILAAVVALLALLDPAL